MMTPPAKRIATTVVPCGISSVDGPSIPAPGSWCGASRRSTSANDGPGSTSGVKRGSALDSDIGAGAYRRVSRRERTNALARASLLPTLLHVGANELLGVVLEDGVDFIEEVVDVFLQLLAAIRGCRHLFVGDFLALFGSRLLFAFPFSHDRPPAPPSARRQSLDELSGCRYLIEQFGDVLLATTRGLHHRDPSQRINSDVEHEAVPIRGHNRVCPAGEACTAEIRAGRVRRIGHRREHGVFIEQTFDPPRTH